MISNTHISIATLIILGLASAPAPAQDTAIDMSCIDRALTEADDETTLRELRRRCSMPPAEESATSNRTPVYEQDAFDERFSFEEITQDRPFRITTHQPSYIMWSAMDEPNVAPFQEAFGPDASLEDSEMVFQLSIKAPIWRNIFGSNMDGYFGYTTKSYWQLFNDDFSAPFRETNYQPELFIRNFRSRNLLGMKLLGWDLSLNHESNGRAEPLSRSWNRVINRFVLNLNDDLSLLGRVWWRIPEDEEDDDNPRMYQYYGYGDVRAIWSPNANTFTALLRPGTKKLSYELTWSYPISKVFRVYALYYNGYGESLIDYNYKNERIGIGITLNDFLTRN